MTLLLVLGLLLVVVSIVLVASATTSDAEASGVGKSLAVLQAMTAAPKALTDDIDRPFSERVWEPLQARTLGLGRRLSGADSADRIRRKLDLAGNPPGWTVDRVTSGKVVGADVGLGVALLFSLMLGAGTPVRIAVVLAGAVAGFFGPNLYLYQKAYDRSAQIQRDLPDAIDLMTISVESGLRFDAAVQQVSRNTSGPLADEFSRVLREMQIGQGRAGALGIDPASAKGGVERGGRADLGADAQGGSGTGCMAHRAGSHGLQGRGEMPAEPEHEEGGAARWAAVPALGARAPSKGRRALKAG